MPDFERLTRSAELHMTRNDPYQGAYIRGVHAGKDAARREVAIVIASVALLLVVLCVLIIR